MARGPFENPAENMMYERAINSLYNGTPVMPWERELLAMAPLPEDIVDPFASQDADPLQIMGLTYRSLVTWIDEARKANYFTKRFTDLSKLVLKGVNTMGRGLMTLHNRGEDLAQAPMQIGELISVGSYHLRKSYLGVIQTASSYPEISERLLINQLSWTNMLLRLYKTKEKLAIPNEEVRRLSNEEVRMKKEELSDGKDNNSSFFLHNSSFGEVSSFGEPSSFDELDALFEPAALSAPRALSSLDKGAGKVGRLSPKEEPYHGQETQSHGQETPEKTSENNTQKKRSDIEITDEKPGLADDHQKEKPENKTSDAETAEEKNHEEETRTSEFTEQPSEAEDKTGPEIPDEEQAGCPQPPVSGDDPGSVLPDPKKSELPKCLQIIEDVCTRSDPSSGGSLIFTFDEIRFLASDPVFDRLDPKMAAEMRRLSNQIDSG